MAGMKRIVFGFFLLLLSLVVHASATEIKTVTFDMKQTRSYEQFMNQVLYKEVQKTAVAMIEGRPKLGKQKVGGMPDTLVHVVVKTGAKGEVAATVAVRADNFYIMGFKALDGSWYGFKNTAYLLRATELSFDDTYKGLTGAKQQAYKEMVHVAVGKAATEQATLTLANYKVGGAISEEDVRKALATMVLTISEGQRFAVIKQNVTALWAAGGTVSQVGIDLLVKWNDVSCALLVWDKEKQEKKKAAKWGDVGESEIIKKFGDPQMVDATAAAANVGFILDVKSCSK